MIKEKILIVEDDELIADYFKLLLARTGYDIVGIVSHGEDVLKKTEELSPELILMDIMLKGSMDGIDAASQVNERFDVPIIFLSGNSDDNIRKRIEEIKHYDFLIKPVRKNQLHDSIQAALKLFSKKSI